MPGTSKQVTAASAAATTVGSRAILYGYAISHGDTSQSSVTFRDETVSGTIRWVHSNVAGTASGDKTDTHSFGPHGMEFPKGIFMVLAGTDTAVCIHYKQI